MSAKTQTQIKTGTKVALIVLSISGVVLALISLPEYYNQRKQDWTRSSVKVTREITCNFAEFDSSYTNECYFDPKVTTGNNGSFDYFDSKSQRGCTGTDKCSFTAMVYGNKTLNPGSQPIQFFLSARQIKDGKTLKTFNSFGNQLIQFYKELDGVKVTVNAYDGVRDNTTNKVVREITCVFDESSPNYLNECSLDGKVANKDYLDAKSQTKCTGTDKCSFMVTAHVDSNKSQKLSLTARQIPTKSLAQNVFKLYSFGRQDIPFSKNLDGTKLEAKITDELKSKAKNQKIKCVFQNGVQEQTCYSSVSGVSCTGKGSCEMNVAYFDKPTGNPRISTPPILTWTANCGANVFYNPFVTVADAYAVRSDKTLVDKDEDSQKLIMNCTYPGLSGAKNYKDGAKALVANGSARYEILGKLINMTPEDGHYYKTTFNGKDTAILKFSCRENEDNKPPLDKPDTKKWEANQDKTLTTVKDLGFNLPPEYMNMKAKVLCGGKATPACQSGTGFNTKNIGYPLCPDVYNAVSNPDYKNSIFNIFWYSKSAADSKDKSVCNLVYEKKEPQTNKSRYYLTYSSAWKATEINHDTTAVVELFPGM